MSEDAKAKKSSASQKEIGRRVMERLGQEIHKLLTSLPETNPDFIFSATLAWTSPQGALASGLKKLNKPIGNEKIIACELEVDSKTVVLPENRLLFGILQEESKVIAFAVITPAGEVRQEVFGDTPEYFDHIYLPMEIESWQSSQIENFVFTAVKSLMDMLERPYQDKALEGP